MKETIGWIGVGSMGHRMSRHLSVAGYPLVMADAAIRFPAVLDPSAPQGASALALVALLVVMTGVVGELVWMQADDAASLRERLRPVRQLLHR